MLMLACGGDDGGTDGGGTDAEFDANPSGPCQSHDDCQDGRFCNGSERCDPAAPSADARGCVPGEAPCAVSECEEAARRCPECPDADGDGYTSARCGGDDCDDADPSIHPGAVEVCDPLHVDEDCDPSTFAGPEGDLDADGHISSRCCNFQPSGALLCGDDCDDEDPAIHPGQPDICDGVDNNCSGVIDEHPNLEFCRDADMDGFGDPAVRVTACFAPPGYVVDCTDCDDTRDFVRPGAPEICDGTSETPGLDENCNGESDEGCDCSPVGLERPCGPPASLTSTGECRPGVQTCRTRPGGTEWSSCVDAVVPREELCNGLDDDCDGTVDETFSCIRGTVETGTNACGRAGSRTCNSACAWSPAVLGTAETVSTCDYCDDTGTGFSAEMGFATASADFAFTKSTLGGTRYYEVEAALGGNSECWHATRCELVGTGTGGHLTTPPRTNFNKRGAVYSEHHHVAGYGPIRFEAEVFVDVPGQNVVPGDGVALVVVGGPGAASWLGAGAEQLGVPRDRDGVAVEWRFFDADNPSVTADSLVLRRLSAAGADPIVLRAAGFPDHIVLRSASDFTYRAGLRLELTPEVPGATGTTAMRVSFRFYTTSWGPWTTYLSCGHAGEPACGASVVAGQTYRFGVTGATAPSRSSMIRFRTDDLEGQPPPNGRLEGMCP
ncbi:MAG: putative metal-binding motif-containing protein [Myxococcales bacterium]|nr:putative metal-binding motif-containing protein [Myxococcales bacterium]